MIRANILHQDKKIFRDEEYVYFPIVAEENIEVILKDFDFALLEWRFLQKEKKIDLHDILENEFPNEPWGEISLKFDQIGNICLLRLDPEETSKEFRVRTGELIVENYPKIATAVNKKDITKGLERVFPLEYLSGVRNFKSWHREYGVDIKIDLENAYFNPRLAEEHCRVSHEIRRGEKILDLFTGVGPFALHSAKIIQCRVYAVDINPVAISCLEESIRRNKLKGEILPIIGNAETILRENRDFDRIIINLPELSIDFLGLAAYSIKNDGFIHMYQFINVVKLPIQFMESLIEDKLKNTHKYKIHNIQIGREISPSKVQMNADLQILSKLGTG